MYLCMCMHIRGMRTHTYVCVCILVPGNTDFGVLILFFVLFCFVLIIYLGLVESSFHMFSIRVSRIICFTCFDC